MTSAHTRMPADRWGEFEGVSLNGYGWLGKLEFNLYGDPLVSQGRCRGDDDCGDPSPCDGVARCVDGFCVPDEPARDCSHLDDGCTVGRCDPTTGECVAVTVEEGARCDDGLFCTAGDTCRAGECIGQPRQCFPTADGFAEECDEEAGRCTFGSPSGGLPSMTVEWGCAAAPGRPGLLLGALLRLL